MAPVKLYYWRGKGPVGSVVRHATSSQWDHVAVSVVFAGVECYFESYPGAGFRMVPVEGDTKPDGVQDSGLVWTDSALAQVMLTLSRRRYSIWNGIRAALGFKSSTEKVQCAQAASIILTILGMNIDPIPEPQQVANEVERMTGNPVRIAA